MKRFFTRHYWHFRREQFIRWLARDYIEAERKIFVRYREGIIAEDKVRNAELTKFSNLVRSYGEALECISRMHSDRTACQIAHHALRPHVPFRPTGISLAAFRELNKLPLSRPAGKPPAQHMD